MASTNIEQSGSTTAIKVYANVTEKSTSGNYRTLYIGIWAQPEDGYGYLDRDGTWSIDFSGVISNSGTGIINDDGMWMYESGNLSVYVAPGTNYADVNIEFTATLKSSTAGAKTVRGTITRITGLSLVADTSISSAADIDIGDNCSISWTPASSSFYYKLKFEIGSWSHTTDVISPGTESLYTYSSYAIPMDIAYEIPDSEAGVIYVSLYQYKDYGCTSQVGSAGMASFKATLADNIVPTIDSITLSLDNSKSDALAEWGVALAGFSKIKIDATASGKYGSIVSNFTIQGAYNITVPGYKLSYTGGTISSSGNKQFIITCTDSRGRKSSAVTSDIVPVLPYVAPKISKLKVSKNDRGTESTTDDKMVITAAWTYDSITGLNSVNAKIEYKYSTADDWITYNGTLTNGVAFELSNLTLEDDRSYNFRLTITDALGTTDRKEAFSSTIHVLMDFQAGGKGLGLGKMCEINNIDNGTSSLEVSMDSYFFGEIYIKDKNVLLEDYIRSTMKILSDEMYGLTYESVNNPRTGQIFYQKVST